MPEIDLKELKKEISSENFSPVYFFFGEEKYTLKFYIEKISTKSKKVNFPQFNLAEFSDDNSIDEIADFALTMPFMAERKFVFINDFNVDTKNTTETSKLNDFLSQIDESVCIVFSLPTLIPDFKKSAKWRNFLKSIQKVGSSVEFKNLTNIDLVKFLMKTADKSGSSIDKYCSNKLIEYVGSSMTNLKNECEKLSAFAQDREITMHDIENLTVKNLDTTVYILIKSIISNDYKRAYELMNLLFTLKEEPVRILSAISDNYVDLYRVRAALQSGKTSSSPTAYGEYKGREFRLRNAERDVRNISTEKLSRSLELLVETDLKLKSTKTSNKVILEELIAKLLVINKGGI